MRTYVRGYEGAGAEGCCFRFIVSEVFSGLEWARCAVLLSGVLKILQRHIFGSVLATCGAALGLLIFVLMVGNALKDLLGYMLSGQLSVQVFLQLLVLLVPYVAAYALPGGILTGVLLVLGRMSAQNEVTAMRAAGLGIGFVARPVLIIGVLGVILCLAVNCYYAPVARSLYSRTIRETVRSDLDKLIVPRTFIRDIPGVVVFVDRKKGNRMEDCRVWILDKQARATKLIWAKSAVMDYSEDGNKLLLTLTNVTTEIRNEKNPEDFSEPGLMTPMDEVPLELSLEGIFAKQAWQQSTSRMTLAQLNEVKRRAEEKWAETGVVDRGGMWMKASMIIHEKISSAFGVLAFAVIGVPLGIRVSRKETSANLVVAAVLWLGYYLCMMFVGWLDKVPQARPDLLQWCVPVLFLSLGVFLFRRIGRM